MQQRSPALNIVLILTCCGVLLDAEAEELRFDSAEAWRVWHIPAGVVEFDAEGALRLQRFERQVNAVGDAGAYRHQTKEREIVRGGIWQVRSNRAAAVRAIDGDMQTIWQPDPADGARNWLIEIDLGRVVLAQEVVVRFPDRPGARPFRQFKIFTSDGRRFRGRSDDIFIHQEVYSTSLPNRQTEIRIPLAYERADTLQALDASVDLAAVGAFLPVQYVRLEADALSEDAALAEIEVMAVVGNVAPGAAARGGGLRSGEQARSMENAVDGDMDTQVAFRRGIIAESWRASSMWMQLDLGATFWVDRVFLSPMRAGFGLTLAQRFFAEGENAGLQPLLPNGETSSGYSHFYYAFAPRKIRHLIVHALDGLSWGGGVGELMVYAIGHPAEVVLRSDFIDLGQVAGDNRQKAVAGMSWDAELPPGTRIRLRSRSGNSLRQEYAFYDRKGEIISQLSWTNLPKVLRGPIDSTVVTGGDWDEWSNIYQVSGEPFKSVTPARLLQLEAILSTENPQVTPVLRSLSLDFSDALVQRAQGRILPRQAAPNQSVRFSYGLWPSGDGQDRGFDRLRMEVPGPIAVEAVTVAVGGKRVTPVEVRVEADSLLFITLPAPVRNDSVRIGFAVGVLRNATVFSLHLGDTRRSDIWQFVNPIERYADVVFLPELIGRDKLIGNLEVYPAVFSPNNDGINDTVEIRFAILKAQVAQPQVKIRDLAGRLIAELARDGHRGVVAYRWDGRDARGLVVAPGLYLFDVDLRAESGDGRAVRSVAVVY
ncbi:MAG: hypothetical protein HOL51_13205 [Gemmatimonadetes bacterium]|jgi:hypothetical protein|nr:hypothetical protein [Gemmatimonadota bacterium]MBT5327071.1 hypothetical protein [Gemmatimonadota bacterium]MBT5448915.1 hypothetical protein [Gemmatimonadota bacterium]MBT5801749.1 hypothetical protein [Gemmatimonadota bacterium]MBT6904931.1 hypothetical protein [Gemmatimonadota bacterium]